MEILGLLYGIFSTLDYCWVLIATALLVVILGYTGAPFFLWAALIFVSAWGWGLPAALTGFITAVLITCLIPPMRRALLTNAVVAAMKKFQFLPKISETEIIALKAGSVWAEGELFSGKPNMKRLMNENYPKLSAEEQAFIDGPCEKLCEMADDWKIHHQGDLPKEIWDFIKRERFLGMIIPKEYGGLGFSATAHSEVIQKLASRSMPVAISVMVPNSLGPAELLNHYGTDEQKKYLLPRLAVGDEIPCFGLTEPTAGSDAGSIGSYGVVFKGDDGKLYMRLQWNKRWITLAAVSTIIGLAFRLRDPENLLGRGEDLGITCALIPASTPGVVLGRRHDPLGVPFVNCPTRGEDVVVSIDAIVGGAAMAGHGWKMLMECLAAGRGISLPAQSMGSTKLTLRATSAHSVIRKQFGVNIGKFEGIEEPLARIGGLAYLLEAARLYTVGAIDRGAKPPVVTAIAKYNFTEICRDLVNDGMDIMGGAGISKGPRNLLAQPYIGLPVGITVEGANILTRTLIIFGQGALRAHPYAFKEVDALEAGDMKKFDAAFWAHVGHVVRNMFRSIVLSLTRGYIVLPYKGGATMRYYQKLAWVSATFAFMADLAMGSLGGKLKMKEKITGRFADVLSWMYLATATLRRFEAEGRRKEDEPFLHWSMQYSFTQMHLALDGLFGNFEIPLLSWFFRGPLRVWHNLNSMGSMPSDALGAKVADLIQRPGEQRERLVTGIYVPKDPLQQLRKLEDTMVALKSAEATASKIRKGIKAGKLQKKKNQLELLKDAVAAGVINQNEFDTAVKSEQLRFEAIQVDDFAFDDLKPTKVPAVDAPLGLKPLR